MEFKRVTELLDKAVKDVPEKIGFVDIDGEMTYREMYDISIRIAKAIICATGEDPAKIGEKEPQPVATLIEAGNDLAACMHGITIPVLTRPCRMSGSRRSLRRWSR